MKINPSIEKLTDEAIRVFGNEEKARTWLSEPHAGLGGKYSPLEHAVTSEHGLKAVQDLMVCVDHGLNL